MLNENRIYLAKHRLSGSKVDYEAAQKLIQDGFYKVANNRAYYSIFHAIRAVLALDFVDFKKHSAVIAHFQQHYIKTKIFNESFSDVIRDANFIRNESDYNDFFIASKEEAEIQISNAKDFYDAVSKYIEQRIQLGS